MNTPMVYCADHPATALLEILVHLDAEDSPSTFQLLEIDIPDSLTATAPDLQANWADDVAMTQQIGSDFIAGMSVAVMKVPCAIVPFAHNYLLNPALAETAGIGIVGVTKHPIDTRLLA